MLTRRDLLKRSVLFSLAPSVPAFLANTARAALAERDRRILVVIQLDGGNDALNTVVPFRDEQYALLRPQLKIATDRLIKLNAEVGLHPAMASAGKLFEAGQLAVVQGVGYPNPNRSHFESMAIWQSARLSAAEHGQYGWLGRALDPRAAETAGPHAVYAGSGSAPVTLWGRRSEVATIPSLDDLALAAPADALRGVLTDAMPEELARKVAQASSTAFTTSEQLSRMVEAPPQRPAGEIGESQLASHLRTIGALIKSDSTARVYYAVQSGYDTHAGQVNTHATLLREFANSLKSFLDDMSASGLAERVLVMAFSEFGRRAAENQSAGTDHGAAGAVFLAGPKLLPGVIGAAPNLLDLDQGDVKVTIDFRQVYATTLNRWLDIPSASVLGAEFEELPILAS